MATRSSSPLMPDQSMLSAVLMPLRLLITVVLLSLGLLLLCWIVNLTLFFGQWQRDATPLLRVFEHDLQLFGPEGRLAHLAGLAESVCSTLHRTVFVVTGLENLEQQPDTGATAYERAMGSMFALVAPGLSTLAMATQLFGLRLAMLAGMLPLILLVYVVAYADGVAERAVRRAGAGRESSSLYHRAKYMQYTLLGALLVLMLCIPVGVNAMLVMLTFVACMAVLVRVQWTFYKKYL